MSDDYLAPYVPERSPLGVAAGHRLPRDLLQKDWDRHVAHADALSRTPGFQNLRNAIIARAQPSPAEHALDIGVGTGLLALPLAERCAVVWAIDVSPAMIDHLRRSVAERSLANLHSMVGSATTLPLADASVSLVVSNYCFHHLREEGKRRLLAEAHRVLTPGGRLVFGDMMFGWSPTVRRNRQVIGSKVRSMASHGPAGFARIARNALKVMIGASEHPAPPSWWREALRSAGFVEVEIECLSHEGAIAMARKEK